MVRTQTGTMTSIRGAATTEAGVEAMEAVVEDTTQTLASRCSKPQGRICGAWEGTDITPSAGAGCTTTCHKGAGAAEGVSRASSQLDSPGQLLVGHVECQHAEASLVEDQEATCHGVVRCPPHVQRRSPSP